MRDARPPRSKFFLFHAVFGKIWQNRMLPSLEGWHPHLEEILDPPLQLGDCWIDSQRYPYLNRCVFLLQTNFRIVNECQYAAFMFDF